MTLSGLHCRIKRTYTTSGGTVPAYACVGTRPSHDGVRSGIDHAGDMVTCVIGAGSPTGIETTFTYRRSWSPVRSAQCAAPKEEVSPRVSDRRSWR